MASHPFRRPHLIFGAMVALLTLLCVVVAVKRYRMPSWLLLPLAGLCAVRLPKRLRTPREPTSEEVRMAEHLRASLAHAGLSGKQAAALAGIQATQHARRMGLRNGQAPSLTQLVFYPRAVKMHLIERLALDEDAIVISQARLVEIIRKLDAIPDVLSTHPKQVA